MVRWFFFSITFTIILVDRKKDHYEAVTGLNVRQLWLSVRQLQG